MQNGSASAAGSVDGECFRVGLMGLGHILPAHLDALRNVGGFQLACVCDRDPARVRQWSATLGCPGFTTPEVFFASPIDVAVLMLPHHLHAPMATRALEAGLHVVVEKPMATTPADCSLMIDAAQAADRLLFVADTAEFTPGAVRTARHYRAGLLGQLLTGSSVTARQYFTPERPAWFLDPVCSGGGMFANVGVHRIAMTRTAVPGLQPLEVTATVHRLPGQRVEACTTATVRYTNGAVMQYQEIGHVATPPWLRTGTQMLFEHGFVGWDDERWYFNPVSGEPISEPLRLRPGYEGVYEAVHRLLRDGSVRGHARGPAQDVAIVAAAYQSAELGRPIPIPSPRSTTHDDACLTGHVPAYR